MSYPVVRLDNLAGTNDPAKLRSIHYVSGTTATAIPNGSVVLLDSLESGEREIWKATAVAANTAAAKVALVASPELMYDERLKNLSDFTNAAGAEARAYKLEAGDIFSVSYDGLETSITFANIAADNVVELAAGTKFQVVASATSGSTVIGRVIAKETVGTIQYVVIEVE